MIQRWCLVPATASDDEMRWLGARTWAPKDLLPGNLRLGVAEFDDPGWESANALHPTSILPSLTAPASSLSGEILLRLQAEGITILASDDVQQALRKLLNKRGGSYGVDKIF